jgi:nicotinamide-nucleotide amidase
MTTEANESQVKQLGVPLELLQAHGSVSEEAVEALAHATLAHSRADCTGDRSAVRRAIADRALVLLLERLASES